MPIAKVRNITIERFRRIQSRTQFSFVDTADNPADLKVFAGPNGSGKTSVLEAILFGLGREDLIAHEATAAEKKPNWRVRLSPETRIEVELMLDGQRHRLLRTSKGHEMDGLPFKLKINNVEYFSSWRAPALVGPRKPLVLGKRPRDTEANRLWRLKQRLIDWKSKKSFVSSPAGESLDAAWLRKLNNTWSMLHNNDGTSLDIQIVDQDSEDVYADLFVIKNGIRLCSVDQVSSGEIEIVSIAGSLILNEFTSGILLIDEPELHLHPQWQATFLPALRELTTNTQFICASHADAPWNQALPFERELLVPESDPRSETWRTAHTTTVNGMDHS